MIELLSSIHLCHLKQMGEEKISTLVANDGSINNFFQKLKTVCSFFPHFPFISIYPALCFTCSDDEACSGVLSSRTRIRRGNRREIPFPKKKENQVEVKPAKFLIPCKGKIEVFIGTTRAHSHACSSGGSQLLQPNSQLNIRHQFKSIITLQLLSLQQTTWTDKTGMLNTNNLTFYRKSALYKTSLPSQHNWLHKLSIKITVN